MNQQLCSGRIKSQGERRGGTRGKNMVTRYIIIRVNAPYWIFKKANSEISSKDIGFECSGVKTREFIDLSSEYTIIGQLCNKFAKNQPLDCPSLPNSPAETPTGFRFLLAFFFQLQTSCVPGKLLNQGSMAYLKFNSFSSQLKKISKIRTAALQNKLVNAVSKQTAEQLNPGTVELEALEVVRKEKVGIIYIKWPVLNFL